ncbi:MAG TPA: hypothetical protein VJW20_19030, partial [Candidatus Angelobacter sp.]|nr:hypothetical protein [Candidatus Angelobacter sp.]
LEAGQFRHRFQIVVIALVLKPLVRVCFGAHQEELDFFNGSRDPGSGRLPADNGANLNNFGGCIHMLFSLARLLPAFIPAHAFGSPVKKRSQMFKRFYGFYFMNFWKGPEIPPDPALVIRYRA